MIVRRRHVVKHCTPMHGFQDQIFDWLNKTDNLLIWIQSTKHPHGLSAQSQQLTLLVPNLGIAEHIAMGGVGGGGLV